MNYKFLCLLTFAVGNFFIYSCKKSVLKAVDDNSISLYHCSDNTAGMPYICFDSLMNDSRCPMAPNVECFWQGTAIVQLTFHESNSIHIFRMSLDGFPSLGYPIDTTINGYKIKFTDLKPYPEYNKPFPKAADIKAIFSIIL